MLYYIISYTHQRNCKRVILLFDAFVVNTSFNTGLFTTLLHSHMVNFIQFFTAISRSKFYVCQQVTIRYSYLHFIQQIGTKCVKITGGSCIFDS